MRNLRAVCCFAACMAGAQAARGQEVHDLRGTWTPKDGAHLVSGPSRHAPSGTAPVEGDDTLQTHASQFVFRFEGQEGRTFWGVLSSDKVSEKLIGAISADGKRFAMTDQDGSFHGTVVDADTLDYCYTHITPTDQAVACGLLVRDR